MKLGDTVEILKVCEERVCEECSEPAKYKHTFLLDGSRRNPASTAYGKDDCSWCEDDCKYSCKEHEESIRRNSPRGMIWCATFSRDKFEHMFLYWKEKSSEKIIG